MSGPLPLWSVLLPTHDGVNGLRASIQSVLAQPDSLELLVVGDGVTDATRAVLAEFDDPRLAVHDLPKAPGYGYTSRQTVLAGARGRWVAFAADDDLWAPDHLAVLGTLLGSGAELAHTRSAWVTPEGSFTVIPFRIDDPRNVERFRGGNSVPATCWAAARVAIERAGGWPADVAAAADWKLWNAIAATASVASSRRVTALHFRSPRRSYDHPGVDGERALLATAGFAPPRLGDALPVLADSLAGTAADPVWWARLTEIADLQVDWDALAAVEAVEAAMLRARELESALARIKELKHEVSVLRGTISWRVTAPLRKLRAQLRKVRNPQRAGARRVKSRGTAP